MIELSNLNDAQQERMCDLCENHFEGLNRGTCEGRKCDQAIEYLKDEIEAEEVESEQEKARQKEREINIDYMLLYGMAKLFSMQSTRFIGEVKHQKTAYFFEKSVRYIDGWIKCMEGNVKTEQSKIMDDLLIDDMSNWIMEFRKHLIEQK